MAVTIITNNVPRFVIDACELSPKEREHFDYLDWNGIDAGTESASFVHYRGQLHDIGEFLALPAGSGDDFAPWHGIANDTFFSGVLIRYVDSDSVVMGRYFA